ncbi:hypothetical protein [Hoeflea sp.]|uniref:hypothetical protein n=1 Tax=Hoeflea sp. TaxID=1940281 RepID=UPI003B012086
MSKKRIFVVEPQLVFLDGHEHTQIKAIEVLLPDCDVFVFTRQDFRLSGTLDHPNLMPVLPKALENGGQNSPTHDEKEQVTPGPEGERYQAFADTLHSTLSRLKAAATDCVLVPSASHETISAAISICERTDSSAVPPFKLRILSDVILADLEPRLLKRLRDICLSGRIGLVTETIELRKHIEQHFKIPVYGQLMLPCTLMPGEEMPASKGSDDAFVIGVLGRQRAEKGSYRIPAILNHLRTLAAERDSGLRFRIKYQAVRSKRARRLVLKIRSWLGRHKNPNVTMEYLTSGMSEEEFRRLVCGVDILLLPYSTKRYGLSGSGIVVDGVLAGKPFVYSRGMANQELLSLGNAEAAAGDREFAEKILTVAENYQRYIEGAKKAAEHSNAVFANIPLALDAVEEPVARKA